jgi:hypothetical protein
VDRSGSWVYWSADAVVSVAMPALFKRPIEHSRRRGATRRVLLRYRAPSFSLTLVIHFAPPIGTILSGAASNSRVRAMTSPVTG